MFKMIENVLLICIEVILVVLLACGKLADGNSFVSIGYVLSVIGLLAVLNGVVRMCYLGSKKWGEAIESDLM